MAPDTIFQSQQFGAQLQSQATDREFQIYEGVARGQQHAFGQVLAAQKMAEESKVNAVHTAIEQAKLEEYVKRNGILSMELDMRMKMAQTELAIAESKRRLQGLEEQERQAEPYAKFLGQPMEVNGQWFKLMPSGVGKVTHVPLSDEEISYAKRERGAKTRALEARASEDEAQAEWYRKGGSAAFPRETAAPHPSLERSRNASTIEKMGGTATAENMRRIKNDMPLLPAPLTDAQQKLRQDWAMSKAAKHAASAGVSVEQMYRSIMEDLDEDQATYALFRKEVPNGQ